MLVSRAENGARQGGLRQDLREVGELLDERARPFQFRWDDDRVAWQQGCLAKIRAPKVAVGLATDDGAVSPDQEDALGVCLARGATRIVQYAKSFFFCS